MLCSNPVSHEDLREKVSFADTCAILILFFPRVSAPDSAGENLLSWGAPQLCMGPNPLTSLNLQVPVFGSLSSFWGLASPQVCVAQGSPVQLADDRLVYSYRPEEHQVRPDSQTSVHQAVFCEEERDRSEQCLFRSEDTKGTNENFQVSVCGWVPVYAAEHAYVSACSYVPGYVYGQVCMYVYACVYLFISRWGHI